MNTSIVRIAAVLGIVAAAACNRPSATVGDDLQRDLDMASPAGVSMTPTSGRVDVVSAIEQGKAEAKTPEKTTPRAAPKKVASAPRVTPRAPTPQPVPTRVAEAPAAPTTVEAPAPVAQAPVEAPAPTVTPTPSPVPSQIPTPAPRGRQRGGTWTMGDVIRNAPFPINP